MLFRSLLKEVSPVLFVYTFIFTIVALHGGGRFLYSLDLLVENNDYILDYQLTKLERTRGNEIRNIVVGDSSTGNAIDASLFSQLSGRPTINLALTGSYGLIGSLNMVKQARKLHPEIQNVIFIQTLDIWFRPFSREGFFKTSNGICTSEIQPEFFVSSKWIDRISYETNLKQYYKFAKYIFNLGDHVVFENDYFHASGVRKTFRNGQLKVEGHENIKGVVDPQNVTVFGMIDEYCFRENINCIFIHGPIHETYFKNTDAAIISKLQNIIAGGNSIHAVQTIFPVKNENMGDSEDHVDISYKDTMTRLYYKEVRTLLD